MPTKKNWVGNQQNYVPKGNGDASGDPNKYNNFDKEDDDLEKY